MRYPQIIETISLKELGRLLTIVVSSASIAWAGQLAQSSETFAEQEIIKGTELHHTLSEKIETLPEGFEPSDSRLRDALEDFDESLLLARHALAIFKETSHERRPFREENLKSQVFRLQESVRRTQGLFIEREMAQSFNVSRTGQ